MHIRNKKKKASAFIDAELDLNSDDSDGSEWF